MSGQHEVNLDEQSRAKVVSAHCVDCDDALVMVDGQVRELVQESRGALIPVRRWTCSFAVPAQFQIT